MQIYGILLNIRGILLKNREKTENFRENQRISFLNPLFYALKHKKVIFFKIFRFFFGGSKYSSYLCHR
jgi:hypothetical protein